MSSELGAARLSVAFNAFLLLVKTLTSWATGSIALWSEAIHSGMDLLASLIAWISIKFASEPPDEDHPYGHEKWQNLSGTIEAILVLVAAFLILIESLRHLFDPKPIQYLGVGMVVMAACALVNFFVSTYLYQVAKKTKSLALEADALHLRADLQSSLGVLLGIFLIWLSIKLGYPMPWLDSVIAIAVALFIFKEAWEILKCSFLPFMDTALSSTEKDQILRILKDENCDYHRLRTRSSGKKIFVDFHMSFPGVMSVRDAATHKLRVKKKLEKELDADVTIHFDAKDET